MRTPAIFMVLCFLCVSPIWHAQEVEGKRFEIALGIGGNSTGPIDDLGDHLIAHQFNQSYTNWWWGLISPGTIKYPQYDKSGLNFLFSLTYRLGEDSRVGLLYSNSNFGSVNGLAIEQGDWLYTDIAMRSKAFIPYGAIQVDIVQFKAGLGLMANKNAEIEPRQESLKYTNVNLGYMVGMDVVIIDSPVIILKLNSHYLFSSPSSIGPYTIKEAGTVKELPETEIDCDQFVLAISTGLKI